MKNVPVPYPSTEADFWAGLFHELTERLERLGEALAAIPQEDASAASVVRVKSYARALDELRAALEHVHTHRADPRLKPTFTLEGPLAGFLSRLYAWSDEIGTDFERMAIALRKKEPTSVVFSHRAVNRSYAHFSELILAIRRQSELASRSAPQDAAARRALDEHVEELIWATEWLHMALARPPGG